MCFLIHDKQLIRSVWQRASTRSAMNPSPSISHHNLPFPEATEIAATLFLIDCSRAPAPAPAPAPAAGCVIPAPGLQTANSLFIPHAVPVSLIPLIPQLHA